LSPVAGLQARVGVEFGPFLAWDEVNAPMIRHWCEAMGDDNPIYVDDEAARAAGHDGLVAPPTMLQAWVMMGYGGQRPPGSDIDSPFAVMGELEAAGYPGVVAVNCEQEYFEYLRPGDRVYYHALLEAVSTEKTTALGTGFFLTELSTFYNQRDEKVGSMRFRIFRYRPVQQDVSDVG
jgi:acyl dehydratase